MKSPAPKLYSALRILPPKSVALPNEDQVPPEDLLYSVLGDEAPSLLAAIYSPMFATLTPSTRPVPGIVLFVAFVYPNTLLYPPDLAGSKFCSIVAEPTALDPCCRGLRLEMRPPLNSIGNVCQLVAISNELLYLLSILYGLCL